MGCTSAKPKRTTSIEDVASKQPHNASQVPDKNGQVNKGPDKDTILREKQSNETNAVEIPGAHKSFMAPDGIPFIDEDEDEDAESEPGDVQLFNGNDGKNVRLGTPDQNKNIAIVANKETKISAIDSATRTKPNALEETAPPGNARRQTDNVINEPIAISQIKIQEIIVTSTTNQHNEGTSEMKSQTILTNSKVTEHTVEENTECHSDDLHDPRLDVAATKIQANYKGYRTRKDISALHLK